MQPDLFLPIPPQALDQEQATLACMLIGPEAIATAANLLRPEDFYRESHRHIFSAILKLAGKGGSVDVLMLKEAIESQGRLEAVGGIDYLLHLANREPTTVHCEHYAGIVAERAGRRRLIHAAEACCREAYDQSEPWDVILDRAEQRLFAVAQERRLRMLAHVKGPITLEMTRLTLAMDRDETVTGVPSGIESLDRLTAGFQRGDLIILAGRPSMGKTSLALSFAQSAAVSGEGAVAIYSLEMSEGQIAQRLLASEARVDSILLRTGRLREVGFGGSGDFSNLGRAADHLGTLPIFVDDEAENSPLAIRSLARRLAAEQPIALIVVDYLQLMRGDEPAQSKHHELADIARALKATARELNVPVIALSQLSRNVERREDKRPMLSDLRESGALEAEADLVLLLYRESYYERQNAEVPDTRGEEQVETVELLIAKHRSGPTGTVHLGFLRRYARFEDLAQ